jgi:hypothetical protein
MAGEKHTPQTSTEMFSVDLGSRTVKYDGAFFTGVVRSNSEVFIAALKAELKKPHLYRIDLGEIDGAPIRLCISGKDYSGIVETESKSLRDELVYRASLVQERHKRQHSARSLQTTYQDVYNPPKGVVVLRG